MTKIGYREYEALRLLREAHLGRVPENLYGNDIQYQIAFDRDNGMRLAIGKAGSALLKKSLAIGGMHRWDDTARYKVFQITERGLAALIKLDTAIESAKIVQRPVEPIYGFAKYVDNLVSKTGPKIGCERISAILKETDIE